MPAGSEYLAGLVGPWTSRLAIGFGGYDVKVERLDAEPVEPSEAARRHLIPQGVVVGICLEHLAEGPLHEGPPGGLLLRRQRRRSETAA